MKKVRLLFPILLLMCICACTNKPYPQSLRVADSLIHNNPDSAVILLEELKRSMAFEPQATQMYYQLLTIKAKDKAYITQTSDSLIKTVVKYYEERKDRERLPETYYYAGRVYRDLGDAPQALEYLQKAIDASSDQNGNYQLKSRIYSQMGYLYLYQDIYDKTPEVFKEAYKYNQLSNDSTGMVYDLRDIGRSFSTLQQTDSAIYYYKQADYLAKTIKSNHLQSMVNSELSGYYSKLGMYQEAYQTLQIAGRDFEAHNRPPYCATTARYYYYTNQLDSAEYYYSQLLSVNSTLHKAGAYQGLANIAQRKGKYKEALFQRFLGILGYTAIHHPVGNRQESTSLVQLSTKRERKQQITTPSSQLQTVEYSSYFLTSISCFPFHCLSPIPQKERATTTCQTRKD